MDSALVDEMLQVASDILFKLSGLKYSGACTDTVRPCTRKIAHELGADQRRLTESWWGSRLRVVCSCQRGPECGCTTLDEITLGGRPLVSISEVRVDGEALSTDAYRIDDFERLVRIDGQGWPCCQDLTADPATDADTFEVTYTYGTLPPQSGVHAAAVLACELYKACQPEDLGDCRLPRRIQQITRQGMTATVVDPAQELREGLTGIPEVDMFIVAENPNGNRRPAAVWTPDKGRRVRRADT